MFKNIKHKAFTLAEVMVVLAIVTMVVAVSIKITKARFDSANRYLYYAAYSALKTVTAEILLEANTSAANSDWAGSQMTNPIPSSNGTFCNSFVSYVNLSASNPNLCSGSSQAAVNEVVNRTEKDFTLLRPDIILRNGMKLYNVQTSSAITQLTNNTVYNEDGTTNETATANSKRGYTIYVDIDGERNSSVLWEDIFPFYITLNGYVVPAYNISAIRGANNIDHIAASVQYDDTNSSSTRPIERWLIKNVPWQEAACVSGFISGTYCAGITKSATCTKSADNYADCRVRVIAPLKM